MYNRAISGIEIRSLTAAIPERILGTDYFSSIFGEKETRRVVRGTGISSVRSGCGTTTTKLILDAATHLIENACVDKASVDGLVVVTQTPDAWSPGSSFAIQDALGLRTDCFLSDINSGCAGYISGLVQAASLVVSRACSNVLLCTGDINTRLLDNRNHQVRMLFGDAASATLIARGDGALQFVCGADGSGRHALGVPLDYTSQPASSGSVGHLNMDGAAVMSFALRRVPETIKALLDAASLDKSGIDLFALHQPNEFILNYLRRLLDLEDQRLPVDVDGVGNTNSTSIPLLLSRRDWGPASGRKNIVMCGFGVGLAWNAALVDLSNTVILKPVETAS